jgi:hypothetical protein
MPVSSSIFIPFILGLLRARIVIIRSLVPIIIVPPRADDWFSCRIILPLITIRQFLNICHSLIKNKLENEKHLGTKKLVDKETLCAFSRNYYHSVTLPLSSLAFVLS